MSFFVNIYYSNVYKLFYEVEAPLIKVLADMEFDGVNINF